MYQIEVNMAENNPKSGDTKQVLGIMVDLLETVNCVEDVPTFSLKMKLLNNIDFIVDGIMEDYIHGNKNIQ